MSTRSILYQRSIAVNDQIGIPIPTVGEVLDREDDYYGKVSLITATPCDLMVQLDDMGIDFTQLNDYELFLLVFGSLKQEDSSMIFGGLDLTRFDTVINEKNSTIVLRDPVNDIVIDRAIHAQICQVLRKIHRLERNNRKPANGEAQKFMIQRAREKMRRRRNRVEDSQLEQLIVALVNTEQFRYGFEEVRNLTIYQFNESVYQIIKKIDFDHKMSGIYAGTISAKDLSQSDLNWLTNK